MTSQKYRNQKTQDDMYSNQDREPHNPAHGKRPMTERDRDIVPATEPEKGAENPSGA